MISRGELKGRIWRFLNKTAKNPGYYTSDRLDEAIQEALTFISVNMFLAGEGWNTKYIYLDTQSGQTSLDIPGNVALIRDVRYKISDVYYSIPYDDQEGAFSYIGTGVQQAFGYRFRILGRQFIFDPPLSEGGERYMQIEAVTYPSTLVDDNELVDPQYDEACCQYLKYKVASICAASIEKGVRTWDQEEAEWWQLMQSVLNRRLLSSTPIREFLP